MLTRKLDIRSEIQNVILNLTMKFRAQNNTLYLFLTFARRIRWKPIPFRITC